MGNPTLIIGDLFFSSWSAKALAYAKDIGFQHDTLSFPLDYPLRLRGDLVEKIPDDEILRDFCTGCRCEDSFFDRYIQPALPFPTPRALHRVPILVCATGATHFDVVSICAAIYEAVADASLVRSAGETFSWFVHCQADYQQLIEDLSYSKSFRSAGRSPVISPEGKSELRDLLQLCEHYLSQKHRLPDEAHRLFEVGIMNFAHAIIRATELVEADALRPFFERCLARSGCNQVLTTVYDIYNRITEKPKTFSEIAAWYRRHPDLPIIHNWQTDTFHVLENDVAVDLFDRAYRSMSNEQIIEQIAEEYSQATDTISQDAHDFFALIHPHSVVSNELAFQMPKG